jgi:hypothetical protein
MFIHLFTFASLGGPSVHARSSVLDVIIRVVLWMDDGLKDGWMAEYVCVVVCTLCVSIPMCSALAIVLVGVCSNKAKERIPSPCQFNAISANNL